MRRIVLVVLVVAVVLGGCTAVWDFITGFIPEEYDELVGIWDSTVEPPDWSDAYEYHFRADRSFEIRALDGTWVVEYTGTVVAANEAEITVKKIEALDPTHEARMTMCYRFVGSSTDTIDLGWYDDDGDPIYYLTLVKRRSTIHTTNLLSVDA